MAGTFIITTQEHKFSIKVHVRSRGEYLDNGEHPYTTIPTQLTKQQLADQLKKFVRQASAQVE
jgi:hypothetical protein